MEFVFLRLVISSNEHGYMSELVCCFYREVGPTVFLFLLFPVFRWCLYHKMKKWETTWVPSLSTTGYFFHYLFHSLFTHRWNRPVMLPFAFFQPYTGGVSFLNSPFKLFMPQLVKQYIDSPGASHFMQKPFSEIYSKDLALALWKITLFLITYLCLPPKWQNTNA